MARVCLGDGLSGENANSVDGELIGFVEGGIRHSGVLFAVDDGCEESLGGGSG